VAHDFNNMLSIIIGNTELALDSVTPGNIIYDDLMEIMNAAMRSADLTRQLLAFARKQTIAPKVLDLNDTVEGMLKMLRRLIGEDIDLIWLPGKHVGAVEIDPAQVDQLLANLCVIARDAISDVGQITIETGMADIDMEYCLQHQEFIPGEFVVLTVSDNGSGMTHETVEKIFEPFFTTKGIGKGTGLGLSTVYGIVKQNNGNINVYSEPGIGTVFRIYLPKYDGAAGVASGTQLERVPDGNGETILVVEDETSILKMAERMLKNRNYNVFISKTPAEAVTTATVCNGKIDLLITDVVMPEMNGRDLAEKMKTLCPGIKCLYMSGYTANVIAHKGVIDKDVQFIQKPFKPRDLLIKVRETIDSD
jgi:CheY-like chemotaxis protein